MNWGKGIILAFVVFFGVIFTMAYISMQQDISLVADNYYEQELAYEDQIERIKNTDGLLEKPSVSVDKAQWQASLTFPASLKSSVYEGSIQFFRPSNAAFDKTYDIRLDQEGLQSFDVSGFQRGLWKVKISWKSKNREYYKEATLIL